MKKWEWVMFFVLVITLLSIIYIALTNITRVEAPKNYINDKAEIYYE